MNILAALLAVLKTLPGLIESVRLWLTIRNRELLRKNLQEVENNCEQLEQNYWSLFNAGNHDAAERLRSKRSTELQLLSALSTELSGTAKGLTGANIEGLVQTTGE